MYYLYALRSLKDNRWYIGVSKDPEKRLQEHNAGKSKSTKYRRPFVLIYQEAFESKQKAYKYEWLVKHRRQYFWQLKNKIAKQQGEVAKVVTAGV